MIYLTLASLFSLAILVVYFAIKGTNAIELERLKTKKKSEAGRLAPDIGGKMVWIPEPLDPKEIKAKSSNPLDDATQFGGIDLPSDHNP